MNNIEFFNYSKPDKVLFGWIDCASKFEGQDNKWTFTVENSNECFNALILTAIVLVFVAILQIISIIGLFLCLAKQKNQIDKIDYLKSNPSKISPVKRQSKISTSSKEIKSSSSSSSSSQSDSSSSDTESELEMKKKPKKQHQSRKNLKKEQEEKVATIKLPRYKVYKANESPQELVIQMDETKQEVKKSKTNKHKKHVDEDAFSLQEIKKSTNKRRSKSKESRHSRRSSRHSVRGKSSKETRY